MYALDPAGKVLLRYARQMQVLCADAAVELGAMPARGGLIERIGQALIEGERPTLGRGATD